MKSSQSRTKPTRKPARRPARAPTPPADAVEPSTARRDLESMMLGLADSNRPAFERAMRMLEALAAQRRGEKRRATRSQRLARKAAWRAA